MAIIDDHPGLSVEILIDKQALREHRDATAEDPPNAITKYAEVHTIDAFEVKTNFLENSAATYGVHVEVRLDGNKVSSYLVRLKDLKKEGGHLTSGVKTKIGNRWHKSDLVFSAFAVKEDNTRKIDKETEERLKKAGTITVLLHRIKNMRWPRGCKNKALKSTDVPQGVSKFGKVPEKSVQVLGLSHHGGVAAPEKRKSNSTSYCYDTVDGKEDENAFAIFNFKYRSLATLKALHIVPRTPDPTPAPPSPPQSRSATPVPALRQPGLTAPIDDGQDSLSKEELVATVHMYKGHSNGLAGLTQKELMALLQHHRAAATPNRSIKRERDNYADVRGGGKRSKRDIVQEVIDFENGKRRKIEVIVLDG